MLGIIASEVVEDIIVLVPVLPNNDTIIALVLRSLVQAGVPLTDVAQLMGHASVSTTMIYTRASEADLRSAVEKLTRTLKDKDKD
jgi:integrase